MPVTVIHAPDTAPLLACVAVKPHLLRYVVWREHFPTSAHPLPVPGLGPVSAALDMVLVSENEYLRSIPRESVDALGARLFYAVHGGARADYARRFVTDAGTAQFNRFLEQLLRDDLDRLIFEAKSAGRKEKEAIEVFLDRTGLHDMLDFESLKKSAWRLRAHRGAPIIRCKHARPRATIFPEAARGRVHW